jgi:hypothetical protein
MNWQYLPAHHTAKSLGNAGTHSIDVAALNRMLAQASPPPPAPRRKRERHWPYAVASAIITLALSVVAVAGITANPAMARSISAFVSPAPAPRPPATPHVVKTTKRVVFRVTGSAPDGVSVRSYGPDTGSLVGGDYLPVPWHASMPYSADARWYAIRAQLDDGVGGITTEVILREIAHYSDGSRKVTNRVAATGHVAGGYEIAAAQWQRQ